MKSNTTDIILDLAQQQARITSAEIVKRLGVSRQFVAKTLKKLVDDKKLVRFGATISAFYVLPEKAALVGDWIEQKLTNDHLEEYQVLKALEAKTPLLNYLSDNVRSIFDYAFSEMLNNAIEHSQSPEIELAVGRNANLIFKIRDHGLGVFLNIMRKKNLDSQLDAIQELLKGKTTTAPQAHSGEGIFFTSKVADVFTLKSDRYILTVDNLLPDILVSENPHPLTGTEVIFQINKDSSKHVSDIFRKYQSDPNGLGFDKTEILVKLYTLGGVHVSRSQARRLIANIEKFKVVILDFDKVPTVGQAFADEIFRVFATAHPEIRLEPINMNETVAFMVHRSQTTNR